MIKKKKKKKLSHSGNFKHLHNVRILRDSVLTREHEAPSVEGLLHLQDSSGLDMARGEAEDTT